MPQVGLSAPPDSRTEFRLRSTQIPSGGETGWPVVAYSSCEDNVMMMHIFMNWYTEVRTEQVRRHYMGKMDNKEQKFEAVQTMIKSFASQLEQGIGNSPRSRKA